MNRFVKINKEEFENVLSKYVFYELCDTEYLELAANNNLEVASEYIYKIGIDGNNFLLVLSSVSKLNDKTRGYGSDAIRIFPMHPDLTIMNVSWVKRVNRATGWQKRFHGRISEILDMLGYDVICEECGARMYLRKNGKTRGSFLSCSKFPECKNGRSL